MRTPDKPLDELPAPQHLGVAGASAQREGAARRARREKKRADHEARVRERHPLIGGALLALGGQPAVPQGEKAWAHGAAGEERVGRYLDRECPRVSILHDRRIPRSRANIDHIVVTSKAVWVIDTKRYAGQVKIHRPLFGQPFLTVAGRKQGKLLAGLDKQVNVVRAAVVELGITVKVRGALCFIDADWPWFRRPQDLSGRWVGWPQALPEYLNAQGGLTEEGCHLITEHLAEIFKAA